MNCHHLITYRFHVVFLLLFPYSTCSPREIFSIFTVLFIGNINKRVYLYRFQNRNRKKRNEKKRKIRFALLLLIIDKCVDDSFYHLSNISLLFVYAVFIQIKTYIHLFRTDWCRWKKGWLIPLHQQKHFKSASQYFFRCSKSGVNSNEK